MDKRMKIAIVDDDKSLREMIRSFIDEQGDMRVVSVHSGPEEALQQLTQEAPDVVLMDINMPGMDGIACVRALRGKLPQTRFIMLTAFEDGEKLFRALEAGASGYLLKRMDPLKLLETIREVKKGGALLTGSIAVKIIEHFQKTGTAPEAGGEGLTEREQEVLKCLSSGMAYKQIAATMAISLDTVRYHVRNIYDKLNVHSRTDAVNAVFPRKINSRGIGST